MFGNTNLGSSEPALAMPADGRFGSKPAVLWSSTRFPLRPR